MERLLKSITQGRLIGIKGKVFKIKAKSVYVTQSQPFISYTKLFLERHHALVVCPRDNFAYFGKDVGSIGIDPPIPKNITYNGKRYRLTTHDYQIVICLEFGEPLKTEGEVEFWDFQSIDDPMQLISIGQIKRNSTRADIVAQVIENVSDISVLNLESYKK